MRRTHKRRGSGGPLPQRGPFRPRGNYTWLGGGARGQQVLALLRPTPFWWPTRGGERPPGGAPRALPARPRAA
eukprot:11057849-Alexandrium_andersonii.AAC.1